MEKEVNPYRPPQPTPPTVEAGLKKTPVLLVILFAVVTCGIYVPFWYWSRRHALNQMAPERGITGLCTAVFILLVASSLVPFAFAMEEGSAELAPEQRMFPQLLNLAYVIILLVLGFRVKGILEANYPDRISGVGVFFLNLYYLQYKINRLGHGEPQAFGSGLT